MPSVDYILEDDEQENGYFDFPNSSDEEELFTAKEAIYPQTTISTLMLIDDYISSLRDAKKTVVGI